MKKKHPVTVRKPKGSLYYEVVYMGVVLGRHQRKKDAKTQAEAKRRVIKKRAKRRK